MAWDKGFNFRATTNFVTDGANETYGLLDDIYPVTRNGVTFGWLTATDSRDRNAGVDRRLAGINQRGNDAGINPANFQIDLSATGAHTLTLAGGDYSNGQILECKFLDNTTVFATPGNATVTGAAEFVDASGVVRTLANWPSQHATIQRTFTSTTFTIRLNAGATTGQSSCLAHVFVSQAGTAVTGMMNTYRQRRI